MTFNISDVGNLEEFLVDYTFRNEGQIKIPKDKREVAYEQSVDVIVDSVSYPQYKNGKANPSLSFYGYATLVYQDSFVLEIPIRFPRQRIYYERQFQAMQSWQNEKAFWENYQFHRKNDISLATIMGSLEIPYDELEPSFYSFGFVELPLREVYVKLLSDSQFRIDYRQVQPIPYTDPFGNERDGKSNQTDGEKDNGVPESGLQPKNNPLNDPWSGNLPTNTPSPESGFALNSDKLGEQATDPMNVPASPSSTGYYIELSYNSCSLLFGLTPNRTISVTRYFGAYVDSVINVTANPDRPPQDACAAGLKSVSYEVVSPSGVTQTGAHAAYGTLNGVIQFGLLPTSILIDGNPFP